ncbi:extracellular solute-binding protein [Ornithinibacillus gellani]|uniref:extracellular solute-binding protein n=1 Tax=Ornithinibacillus gellani TaxID=2293253 RepID=UPI000F47AE7C|nr:extracellular solute-binding protein [Ornithinibacillus gellani]TQS75003.1 extracellular solute-binding protein [Ornithinibacillus gellani]
MKYTKLLLVLVASLFLFTACSKDKEQPKADGPSDEELEILNEKDMPIVNEEVDLEFFAGQAPATNPDWNDVLIFNTYEDMTNMNIKWKMVPHDSIAEQRNLALGSGSLPDAFHSAQIGVSDLAKYGEQGVFVPLNDLIDKYAPNFKKILDENPVIKKAITMPDGNIYSFPLISDPEFASHRIQARPFINKKWLDELGMDMPKTTDEFYQYLTAVKEELGEVPFGGPYIDTLTEYLLGSFGLATKGGSNLYLDEDPETGDIRFYPTSDGYKELIEYVHKLYSEGLIEKNIFSIDHHQFITNLGDGKYGSVVWFAPEEVASKENGKDFVGMPTLEGPHGDKTLNKIGDPVMSPGAFVITSNNEYPAATVRWIDYFYGEEGMKLFFMGVEDETYTVADDGTLQFMDHITNSKDGLTFEEEAAKYLTFPGGGFPSMVKEGLFQGVASAPQSLEAADLLKPDMIPDDEIWPSLTYTKEENDKLQGFGKDIEKYVAEMTDKFISGAEPLSKWDTYVKEIENMGLDKYLEIKETALERQLK